MEGRGYDRGRNREASSVSSFIESGDNVSDLIGQGIEMATPEVNGTGQETTSVVSGRTASTTSSAWSRVYSGIPFDPEGQGPSGASLANALVAFNNASRPAVLL